MSVFAEGVHRQDWRSAYIVAILHLLWGRMKVSGPLDRAALGTNRSFDSDYNVNCVDVSGSGSGSDDNNSTNINGLTGDETSMNASDNSLPLMDSSTTSSKTRKEKSSKSQGKKHKNNSSCSNTSCDSSDSGSRSASSNHIAEMQLPSQGEVPINSAMLLQHEASPNNAAFAAYYSQLIQFSQNIGGIGGIYPGLFLNQTSNTAQSIANSQMYYNSMGGMHMPMNFYYLNSVNSTPTNNNNHVNSADNKNEGTNNGNSQSSFNIDTENNIEVFAIPWNDVIKLFEGEFDNIFGTSSCKAHLDVSEVLVDGAKGRWKHVLLLDTIVAFAFGLEKARPDSERRRFNQYSTLRECVVTIFHKLWVEFVTKQQTYLVEKLKETSDQAEVLNIYKTIQNLAILPKKIRVTGVSFPWHDCIILKNHLLAQSTAKSWKKREESVTFLIDKLQQYNGTLLELYSEVVNKLYYQHLCIPLGTNANIMNSSVNSNSSNSNGNNVTSAVTDANQNNKALLELVAAVESVVADDMKINGKKRKVSES